MGTYRSILNDVLGPIMTGPSSSHCAGCCRIGLTARQLFGKDIEHAEIVFDEAGSYPKTYIGQGSNYGFTGGMLGYNTDDPGLKDAVTLAKVMGKKILFRKDNLGAVHPNQAEIYIFERDTVVLKVMTFSTGGGMFQITKLDEFNVLIEGTEFQYFICCRLDQGGYLRNRAESFGLKAKLESNSQTGRSLICVKSYIDISDTIKQITADVVGLIYVRSTFPVVPNVKNEETIPPFFNAKEALAYAKENRRSSCQLFTDYESGYGHISTDDMISQIRRVRVAMEESMKPVDSEITKKYGFLPYQALKMRKALATTVTANGGVLNDAMLAAISVLENSSAHNIVVAAPTAGSSGVIPAAVIELGHKMSKPDVEIERALMVAGVVGVFIANQATFGGEVGACQAEIGSACSMASAGIVQLLGGSIEQCFGAASLALQNMLGLICDPIAGLAEVPCISRNVAAVANAFTSANMVMLGFDPVVPLDEVIQTMGVVGGALPSELRCTCKGGLCVTRTGSQITKIMNEKWQC